MFPLAPEGIMRHRAALGSVLLALSLSVQADAVIPWQKLQDPHVRAAQFDALTGRPLEGMIQLLADDKLGRITQMPHQVDMVLAGMYLAYGAQGAAGEKLKGLANQGQSRDVQDLAWFRLAQRQYQQGLSPAAMDSLARIQGSLPAASRQERLMMEANILMGQDNYSEALSRLTTLKDPALRWALGEHDVWESYGRFNSAVALHHLGRKGEAQALLQAMANLHGDDEEHTFLRDKANLTLAYDALAQKDADRAVRHFLQARLTGPFAGKALLGLGRSYALQGQHQKSLTPWLELIKRDPADPAVQDALLAVPFAFGQLDAYKQALERYDQALAIYKQEVVRLQAAEREVEKGLFLNNMAQAMSEYLLPSLGQDQVPILPKTNAVRYLWPLFSSPEFQETLRNYARLQEAQVKLKKWAASTRDNSRLAAAYRQSLEKRLAALDSEVAQQMGQLREYLQSLAMAELKRRKERIIEFAGEARFSMAQIYDYAAKRWGGQ